MTQRPDTLHVAWEAARTGRITWDDVRAIQASLMPRCAAHEQPAIAKWYGVDMCERCITEGRHKR